MTIDFFAAQRYEFENNIFRYFFDLEFISDFVPLLAALVRLNAAANGNRG